MNYEFKFKTDLGVKRDHNEDAFGFIETNDLTVFIVCDGMGGHAAGEVASKIAVDTIKEVIQNSVGEEPNVRLVRATNKSNRKVREYSENNPDMKGLGTTAAIIALESADSKKIFNNQYAPGALLKAEISNFKENKNPLTTDSPTPDTRHLKPAIYTAHVGDSRIYKISGEKIEQIGKDHSQVQNLIDEGALTQKEARKSKLKHVILRALGPEENIRTEINGPIIPKPGETFLICSDGLNDMLEDNKIAKIINQNNAEKAAVKLIADANEAGGMDNITVCVIKFTENFS